MSPDRIHRTGVDLVLAGVFGRGAVGGLKDGVARGVVDVAARRDANAADASGQRVADVIAVEVHGGDDRVLGRAREDLLQKGIGDRVLDVISVPSTTMLVQGPPSISSPP